MPHYFKIHCATASCIVLLAADATAVSPKDRSIAGRPCSDAVLNSSHHDYDGKPPVRKEICEKEKQDGVEIVIHKYTDGVGYIDDWYSRVKNKASSHGFLWGAYHFARSETYDKAPNKIGNDPIKQAQAFVMGVLGEKTAEDQRILLAFDVEPYPVDRKKPKGKKEWISLRGAAVAIDEIYRLTGVYPGFYTGKSFVEESIARAQDPDNALFIRTAFSKCWLWYARYEREPSPLPVAAPWKTWMFWQYTTNLKELHSLDISPKDTWRHDIAGSSGEFNYIALPRGSAIEEWYQEHSWDYRLRGSLTDR
jgi:GH25 family lysozyme M1 (1,4-beta-N-acetylmuramidase)